MLDERGDRGERDIDAEFTGKTCLPNPTAVAASCLKPLDGQSGPRVARFSPGTRQRSPAPAAFVRLCARPTASPDIRARAVHSP